jgi:WD40 repeat protein
MTQPDYGPPREHIRPYFSSRAGCSSRRIGSTSLWSPIVKLAAWIIALVGLIEMMTTHALPEPEIPIWGAVASESGVIDKIMFSPDGNTLATVDSNGHAALWDVATGHWSESHPERFDGIRTLAYSPDGRTLAGGALDSTIILWDAISHRVRGELKEHGQPVHALAFSPDGSLLASASGDGMLILWTTTVGKPQGCPISLSSSVVSMAFSRDGETLATSHINGEVRTRDVASPEVSTLIGQLPEVPRALAFSPDGRTLASSVISSSRILCWDRASGCTHAFQPGPVSGVPALAFSPNGRLLVMARSDGTLQFKDVIADRQWNVRTGHTGIVWSVAFSPDGRFLVSGGNDQRIKVWDISKLIELAGPDRVSHASDVLSYQKVWLQRPMFEKFHQPEFLNHHGGNDQESPAETP